MRATTIIFILLSLELGCKPSPNMITLKNARGTEIHVIPYGGIITSIRVADRSGHSTMWSSDTTTPTIT